MVTIEGRASADFNPGAGQATAAADGYPAYWVITFDRPMNKSFKDAIWYDTLEPERCDEPEGTATGPVCELGEISDCSGGESWEWTKDGTQLYYGFNSCQGMSYGIDLVLNPGGDCKAKPFQDMAGTKLPRAEGCADNCEENNICDN